MAKLRAAYFPNLALLIVVLLGLSMLAILFLGTSSHAGDVYQSAQLVLVAASGALGSVLAATFKLRDAVALSPLRSIAAIAYIQPPIGAAFGLVSWLILSSGLVMIGGANSQTWQVQAVVAFASGFSEPLFLNIIGRVLNPRR
jgi:hypothetical protein